MLSWDPTVTARLRELHESGRVELQWLTTWTEKADQLLAEPMGLPRGLRTHSRDGVLSTGFSGERRGVSGWWKLAAARAVAEAEPGRRIVWIDDDLADQAEDAIEWLAANAQCWSWRRTSSPGSPTRSWTGSRPGSRIRPRRGDLMPSMHRSHRVAGALVGSAVGDALGAPFGFGPPGQFSARFPVPARGSKTEMCGGGSLGWEPGEFTDDTQMALLVAESLIERGRSGRGRPLRPVPTWATAGPPDIGNQTRAVLGSGLPWDVAAAEHFARSGHAAGNGSLMRTTPAAIWFSRFGTEATMDAARRISALTHGDPAAGEGCAIFHELMRVALDGGDPLAASP